MRDARAQGRNPIPFVLLTLGLGSIGLLLQRYRAVCPATGTDPLPSTVKALLLHTARDLDDAELRERVGAEPRLEEGEGLGDGHLELIALEQRMVFDADGCLVALNNIHTYSASFVACVEKTASATRWLCAPGKSLNMFQGCP